MEMWCVEYSVEQGCFHVDKLSSTLLRNFINVTKGITTSYVMIATVDSAVQASEIIESLKLQGMLDENKMGG